ncbi:MAG: hypothetical protein IJ156_09620 [Bacteroidales bacterium]|nr:hypothetical protein [Bacteroidales bacterium]
MRITEFKDPFTGRTGIYLFTLDHLERQLIFRNDSDFVFGVNTLALGVLKHKVRVLCYALMDNHIHLLLAGTYPACLAYYRWVLHRLALMLGHRYGVSGVLRWKASDIQAVTDDRMLLNEVCYLLRNGYKARIDSPFTYRWTPFECYFNPYLPLLRGDALPTGREGKRVFCTQEPFPSDWEQVGGRILNKFFVDYRAVEQRIGSGLVLFDRLRRYDLESIVAETHGVAERITFTDSEMQEKIRTLCRNEWHVDSLHQLGRKDLLRLARTLAHRHGASKKQISRLLGIDPAVLETAL